MRTRKRMTGALAVGLLGLGGYLALRSPASTTPPEPVRDITAAAPASLASPASPYEASPPSALPPAPEPESLPPSPSGAIKLGVEDRELYEEMSNVVAYFKQKPLPEHGPVRSVGDGIDSTDRKAKLPPDTPFSRFRYEYEKHTSPRLMDDLTWADGELARLRYDERKAKGSLSTDELVEGELLMRRRRAIVSILDARARDEQIHDRYQRVEVVYKGPNPPAAGAAGAKRGGDRPRSPEDEAHL